MHGRYNRFVSIVLTAIFIVLVLGCTQPEDVIAPYSTTRIILEPERLPSLPADMAYYLWTIDTADQAYYVGRFLWNNDYYRFSDLDGNTIDSMWIVDYDILDPHYRFIAVSVEKTDDLPAGSILPLESVGPIMLRDTIYSEEVRLMKMKFPVDMWLGYGYFCMETPSDSNSNSHESSGIWFCEYLYDSIVVADTFNIACDISGRTDRDLLIDVLSLDTSYFACNEFDKYSKLCEDSTQVTEEEYDPDSIIIKDAGFGKKDTFYVFFLAFDTTDADTAVVICTMEECDTLPVAVLGETLDTMGVHKVKQITDSSYRLIDSLVLDTFIHTYIEYEFIAPTVNSSAEMRYDTITLYRDYDPVLEDWTDVRDTVYTIRPFSSYDHDLRYSITSRGIKVDKFLETFEDCPDLYDTKWHYRGWVLSPYLEPVDVFGKLTKPSWMPYYIPKEISPLDAGMISAARFKSFRAPDQDENPYTDERRVPPYPGEDFLLNLPDGVDSIYFADQTNPLVKAGRVLVTLEPDNYESDSTNFPLIYLLGDIPYYGDGTVNHPGVSDTREHSQRTLDFEMRNKASCIDGSATGFPGIHLTIIRE